MSPVAEALQRDDLMALAQYFSKKPWPKLQQPRAPADVATRRSAPTPRSSAPAAIRRASGRGHAAAACRPGARLSGKDHAGFPQRRPRQQSRHDRSDESDHRGGHLGARRLSRGDVSRPERRCGGDARGLGCAAIAATRLPSFRPANFWQTRTPLLGMAAGANWTMAHDSCYVAPSSRVCSRKRT